LLSTIPSLTEFTPGAPLAEVSHDARIARAHSLAQPDGEVVDAEVLRPEVLRDDEYPHPQCQSGSGPLLHDQEALVRCLIDALHLASMAREKTCYGGGTGVSNREEASPARGSRKLAFPGRGEIEGRANVVSLKRRKIAQDLILRHSPARYSRMS
jgi:hypothetical protein